MDTMMSSRAHARGGPEKLVFERAPKPTPTVGEVLVRVLAAAITFAELGWDPTWTHQDGTDRIRFTAVVGRGCMTAGYPSAPVERESSVRVAGPTLAIDSSARSWALGARSSPVDKCLICQGGLSVAHLTRQSVHCSAQHQSEG